MEVVNRFKIVEVKKYYANVSSAKILSLSPPTTNASLVKSSSLGDGSFTRTDRTNQLTDMNENSPVLDLEPLVEPPAEEQRLEGDFLHGHPLKVDVDPGTFFTQEF